MKEKGFWEGVQAAMPTALGYVSIGLACGIIGAPYVTPVEMGLMSLFVYAGSAQFAMLALIAVQAPVAAIAMTVFLINLRLFLLSLHASTYFRHTSLWQNIGMSSLLTDETYGVLMGELAHADKVNPMWMHGNNLNSCHIGRTNNPTGQANTDITKGRWHGCLRPLPKSFFFHLSPHIILIGV